MLTSLAMCLTVIRRLSKIILFTVSIFSRIVDVQGQLGRASSLTSSRPSLNRWYHNWTYVLLIVHQPNSTVNISNILANLISFFTQNLIQSYLQSALKHDYTFICQKQTDKPIWLILSIYISNMCTNITEKRRKLSIRNPINFTITVIFGHTAPPQ